MDRCAYESQYVCVYVHVRVCACLKQRPPEHLCFNSLPGAHDAHAQIWGPGDAIVLVWEVEVSVPEYLQSCRETSMGLRGWEPSCCNTTDTGAEQGHGQEGVHNPADTECYRAAPPGTKPWRPWGSSCV